MKYLIIGDIHLKDSLGYADYVGDRRIPEREEILDFLVREADDCHGVIMLGDQLDARNNTSTVIRDFTRFVMRFEEKEVFILGGNHELKGDGTSAIDYISEIKNTRSKISVITKDVLVVGDLTFCPYFNRPMLEAADDKELTDKIMNKLISNKYLFVHHAISDTEVNSGQLTNFFPEAVLPKAELEKRFNKVFGGHIHAQQEKGKTTVVGSVFNNQVGETGKFVYKLDSATGQTEKVPIPGRKIYKLVDPKPEEILELERNSIIKAVITDESVDVPYITGILSQFDAYMVLEQYKQKREQVDLDASGIDFSIESLLEIYAKKRGVDYQLLLNGYNLIK